MPVSLIYVLVIFQSNYLSVDPFPNSPGLSGACDWRILLKGQFILFYFFHYVYSVTGAVIQALNFVIALSTAIGIMDFQ